MNARSSAAANACFAGDDKGVQKWSRMGRDTGMRCGWVFLWRKNRRIKGREGIQWLFSRLEVLPFK